MSHDSKKYLKTVYLSLIVAFALSMFAYACEGVPIFLGSFTFMADLVLGSLILSLNAQYKKYRIPLYQFIMICVSIVTAFITVLAIMNLF